MQSYETKVTAKEITNFLQDNAGAIDTSVKDVIQKNYSFLEKYVTKRGLVKLVEQIKTKQIKNVAQFYELIYKIECDGKLQAAAEFVKTRSDSLRLEFQVQFRKFSDAKLVELNRDVNNTREKCSTLIKEGYESIQQYRDIPWLYEQNETSVQKQAATTFEAIHSDMEKFQNVVVTEAKKYELKI